jgi:hypothetical protein
MKIHSRKVIVDCRLDVFASDFNRVQGYSESLLAKQPLSLPLPPPAAGLVGV